MGIIGTFNHSGLKWIEIGYQTASERKKVDCCFDLKNTAGSVPVKYVLVSRKVITDFTVWNFWHLTFSLKGTKILSSNKAFL